MAYLIVAVPRAAEASAASLSVLALNKTLLSVGWVPTLTLRNGGSDVRVPSSRVTPVPLLSKSPTARFLASLDEA